MKRSAPVSVAALALLATFPAASFAAVVELEGKNLKTLSEAVAAAQAADEGPHIINITVDKLPVADGEVVINEPMTINGDADGNGVKCDLLADVASIQSLTKSAGLPAKCYLEIHSAGKVVINDLMIHPNADGSDLEEEFVDGIRLSSPPAASDSGDYELNRVWVSGSDGNSGDAYVNLTADSDLFNQPGIKRWSGQTKRSSQAVIHFDKARKKGSEQIEAGSYNAVLNDCHAGLGKGTAINITTDGGHHVVKSGVYGHCGEHGLRVSGDTVTLTGTESNPLVVLRVPNTPGSGANRGNAVSVVLNAQVDKMEHIVASTINNGTGFSISGKATVEQRRNCEVTDNIATVLNKVVAASGTAAPACEWLPAADAWKRAQDKKQGMLLFFYASNVNQAVELKKLMENDHSAKLCLNRYACSRIDVSDPAGDAIAKKYGIFKVPTLLLIAPDAKSFKKVSPELRDSWQNIEEQLAAN